MKCKAACQSYKYFSGKYVRAQHLQVAAVAGEGPGEEVGRLSPTRSSARGWFLLHRAGKAHTSGQVMCVQDPHSLGRCRVSHSCILKGCPEAVGMSTASPRVVPRGSRQTEIISRVACSPGLGVSSAPQLWWEGLPRQRRLLLSEGPEQSSWVPSRDASSSIIYTTDHRNVMPS